MIDSIDMEEYYLTQQNILPCHEPIHVAWACGIPWLQIAAFKMVPMCVFSHSIYTLDYILNMIYSHLNC
jgi:hypothetical protein